MADGEAAGAAPFLEPAAGMAAGTSHENVSPTVVNSSKMRASSLTSSPRRPDQRQIFPPTMSTRPTMPGSPPFPLAESKLVIGSVRTRGKGWSRFPVEMSECGSDAPARSSLLTKRRRERTLYLEKDIC